MQEETILASLVAGGFTGHVIEQSLRFNDGDSPELSLTYSITAPWTFSAWVKRCELTALNNLLGTNAEIHFNADDTIEVEGASGLAGILFRDPTGWYHVHVSDNGVFVNGVEVIAAASVTTTDLTDAKLFDDFDGYVAEVHLKSGTDAVTNFGAFDANGNWGSKSATSGEHYLTFSNSSVIGENSGTASDWTATNLVAADVVPDSPTNNSDGTVGNWCVLNPLDNDSLTLSDGNLTVISPANAHNAVSGVFSFDSTDADGFYWEVTADGDFDAGLSHFHGVCLETFQAISQYTTDALNFSSIWAYRPGDGKKMNGEAAVQAYGTGIDTGQTFGVLVKNGKIYFRNVAGWENSGDPDAETGAAYDNLTENVKPFYGNSTTGTQFTYNFGQHTFAYTPPTGAKSLNSKTLADAMAPAITKPNDHFVAVVDTEANIAATLATARTGWASYVDILKNRDASETWAWRFSHDGSNEYAVSTTATYQATRALSGSADWVGYSIRVDSLAKARAGSVSHTNGADTSVSFTTMGTARCMVFLFPRSNGEVPVYHPDLTAGELLNLTGTDAAVADSAIKNVTATGFDIDTGEATDTYDYLVIPESDVVKLGKYVGNAAADGPLGYTGFKPLVNWTKADSGTQPWLCLDAVREPFNVNANELLLNTADDEATVRASWSGDMDLLSTGIKVRAASTIHNTSAADHFFIAFAEMGFDPNKASGQPRAV